MGNQDTESITRNFNNSSTIITDPPRYVIQDEYPPDWVAFKRSINKKPAKKQQELKAEARAPYEYMKILRGAFNNEDADTWNSTIAKLRELHPDEVLVFDDDMTVNNKYLDGFDFQSIEFRNVKFSSNIMVECNFDDASFDLSALGELSLNSRGGVFENCTFVACSMDIKAFRESQDRLTETGRTFITENDAALPNTEGDDFVQKVPLFDSAAVDKVDEYMHGRKTEVEGLYKSGCEFIDCIIPEAMERELAMPDENGRQSYMIHMSTNKGISQADPNPYAAQIKENSTSLTDYYDPRSARVKQSSPRLKEPKRSCDASYKWTQRTNHLGGKQN